MRRGVGIGKKFSIVRILSAEIKENLKGILDKPVQVVEGAVEVDLNDPKITATSIKLLEGAIWPFTAREWLFIGDEETRIHLAKADRELANVRNWG
ncbi:MAG: hypothetical protein V1875_04260 [Candidatus Altiarchaeota archaeon]